jgi:carbonic anhydrase/acetyltransferase-like protein (isoleucine patch superfamily)
MAYDLFDPENPAWELLSPDGRPSWKLIVGLPSMIVALGASRQLVSESAKIHPGAQIVNSFIGPDAQVFEGCVVRDSVVLAGTTIGHASEVARSVILQDCMIPRFNYVGSSVLGRGVNLGGGTQLASMRYDRGEVELALPTGTINTRSAKFGSMVGDDARIAFGCHVNPGSVIGARSTIGPLIDWRGYCPPDMLVFERQRLVETRARSIRVE